MSTRLNGRRVGAALLVALLPLGAGACKQEAGAPALSKSAKDPSTVPQPAANGPKLGAVANISPIVDKPDPAGKRLGYLHAGGTLARAAEPFSTEGCPGGWYPVRPRGFVCVGAAATLDPKHPTLIARSLRPNLAEPLPYVYARVEEEASLYKRDEKNGKSVAVAGKLAKRAGMAVVGSWNANDEKGQPARFGMLTNGQFVAATALEPISPSDFGGVELGKETELPIAFVVKQGVRKWKLDKGKSTKGDRLEYHASVKLSGRFRTKGSVKYWALDDESWVREQDVTIVHKRQKLPELAKDKQRWIDVSLVSGVLMAFEGSTAVYTTVVSVGEDRISEEPNAKVTKQGDFEIIAKHVTGVTLAPRAVEATHEVFDAPWVLELSSGQRFVGAFWHGRQGIEHGPGDVQLSPKDAKWLFDWATPALPEGWHGVEQLTKDEGKTLVRIHK